MNDGNAGVNLEAVNVNAVMVNPDRGVNLAVVKVKTSCRGVNQAPDRPQEPVRRQHAPSQATNPRPAPKNGAVRG